MAGRIASQLADGSLLERPPEVGQLSLRDEGPDDVQVGAIQREQPDADLRSLCRAVALAAAHRGGQADQGETFEGGRAHQNVVSATRPAVNSGADGISETRDTIRG